MTAVKDKLVTVESIGALHEYNLQRVIDVAHGGTGATNAEQALINLGAAASHKIGREVEGQQSFVESSAENMLVDLVPYVSIVAKDTTSDSTGAKIQVSDHTNEDLGEAGLIRMSAQKIEVEADVISLDAQQVTGDINFSGSISGNMNLSGDMAANNLNASGNIVVGGTAEFNDTLHIQDSGIYVCDLNMGTNAHAFGLRDGDLEIGLDGKAKGLFDTNINGDNVNIVANNKIIPNVPVYTYAATFKVPEGGLALGTDERYIRWEDFVYTNKKYFECVSSPHIGIKCKRDGAILISSTILISDKTKGCRYSCIFLKNGANIVGQAREALPVDDGMATLSMSPSVMGVSSGDVIGIKVNNIDAATGTIVGGAASRMNIVYLG